MVNVDMTIMKNKKILLVDDELDILNLLETVLKKEGFNNIYKTTSGHETIKMCEKIAPDLIVLDIMLPDIDGFEVCRRLREFCLVPIIFLSAKDDDVDKLLGLGIGGDDYITKPFSPKEVAFRIKAHFRRSEYFNLKSLSDSKRIIRFGDVEIDEDKGEVRKKSELVPLTLKEYSLLLYLAYNPNKILSKNQILEKVWGSDFEGYDNTLMVHIRHLRQKLENDPSNPKYIIPLYPE
ncbi:response regulator transcription factor [Tepidanaerobacter sp. GT38]|nr:response regulator transcription factor [Tepidanaerobacter sp. GT38]MCG1011996.1 response regulator transcription factor [Tepidanaerobacter sp. GT38]